MNKALTKSDSSAAVGALTDPQLRLLKRTVAQDCNDDEFNLFVEVARNLRLDPFRRQVLPLVFSKNDAKKRRMSLVVGIDGMRRIATRTGNYRPASEPPHYEIDEAAKSDTNPHGIVLCRVSVFQQDRNGDWFPVMGEAYWDEFAAIEEEWHWGDERGKKVYTGKKMLSGQWGKMPRLMIAKCAEAQALRRGWPDDLSGVYSEEELDRSRVEELASDRLAEQDRQIRQQAVGGRGILFTTDPHEPAVKWPIGDVADRCIEWINGASLSKQIEWFRSVNREALRDFWAASEGDAHAVKALMEKRIAALKATETEGEAA